jgi:hypothetical protein
MVAEVEELHLLHGELMIDDTKLYPAITTGPRPTPSIIVYGAKAAARAFS